MGEFSRIVHLCLANDPRITCLSISNVSLSDSQMSSIVNAAVEKNCFISSYRLSDLSLSPKSWAYFFSSVVKPFRISSMEVQSSAIGDASVASLCQSINQLPQNQPSIRLTLSKVNISTLGSSSIADTISKNAPISYLDISQNSEVGDEGCSAIILAMATNDHLLGFNFMGCGFGPCAGRSLLAGIEDNFRFQSLKISDTLGTEAMFSLARLLENPHNAISSISIAGSVIDRQFIQGFVQAISKNRSLRRLTLERCRLDDIGGILIAAASDRTSSLRSLTLSCNILTAASSGYFSVALAHRSSLQKLDLSSNFLDSIGVWPLAVALTGNTELKSLNLSANNIDDKAVPVICEMLGTNTALENLCLSKNPITDYGLTQISNRIKSGVNIKSLDLSEIYAGDFGASSLFGAMKYDKSIERLSFEGIKFGKAVFPSITEMISGNSTLKFLSFSGCGLDNSVVPFISEGLRNNFALRDFNISKNLITSDGIMEIVDAMNENFSIESMDICEDEAPSELSSILERNRKRQGNSLLSDLASLVSDPQLNFEADADEF